MFYIIVEKYNWSLLRYSTKAEYSYRTDSVQPLTPIPFLHTNIHIAHIRRNL
jgi:hypothetical protein